jgi:hypothetical protein
MELKNDQTAGQPYLNPNTVRVLRADATLHRSQMRLSCAATAHVLVA